MLQSSFTSEKRKIKLNFRPVFVEIDDQALKQQTTVNIEQVHLTVIQNEYPKLSKIDPITGNFLGIHQRTF